MSSASMQSPDQAICEFVTRSELLPPGRVPSYIPLTGGVSSDVWRVEGGSQPFVVKKALAKLRVAQEWTANTSRSEREVDYFLTVGAFQPESVPQVLAHANGAFAMPFYTPENHLLWKDELSKGNVNLEFASAVGQAMGKIHQATARSAELRARFDNDTDFHALRLAPYLEATARVHPDLSALLQETMHATANTHLALVHGDISPKNILMRFSPNDADAGIAPIFLDAECAWYGDPAFDLAFCLNHLILKSFWGGAAKPALMQAFNNLVDSYFPCIDWEPQDAFEARVARLLPALLLARVDGKSPVEYLDPLRQESVRRMARALILWRPSRLSRIEEAWRTHP